MDQFCARTKGLEKVWSFARCRLPAPQATLAYDTTEQGEAQRPRSEHGKRSTEMVKYMSLEEQVDKEFLRAKHRAFFRRLVARGRGLFPSGGRCSPSMRPGGPLGRTTDSTWARGW
jgi:hypothetical protein